MVLYITGFAQIETDRPDFTESPNVVPKGALQIETGFILENDESSFRLGGLEGHNSAKNVTLNTTLIRYGISDRIELRLNWSYNKSEYKTIHPLINSIPVTINGLNPVFIGSKVNLIKKEKISVGLLSHVYLPWAASDSFQASFIAPEILVPVSIDITDRFGIAFQYGLSWDGETPNPTTSYTLALGYGITDQLSFYVEPYGFLTNSGDELHLINGGFTYLINDNIQLDLTGGLGLNEPAPDNFIGFGASFLIEKKK